MRRCWVVVLSVVLGSTAHAGPEKERPAYELTLEAWSGVPNGKVATLQGTTTTDGDHFFVSAIGVLQPVTVALVAQHPGDLIKIYLGKQRWDEKLREAQTGPDGKAILQLRTQGELRMTVLADGEPKPYGLFVWVGAEVKPDFAPAVMPMKTYVQKHPEAGGGSSTVSVVIAVALVAIVVLLVIGVFRKRGNK